MHWTPKSEEQSTAKDSKELTRDQADPMPPPTKVVRKRRKQNRKTNDHKDRTASTEEATCTGRRKARSNRQQRKQREVFLFCEPLIWGSGAPGGFSIQGLPSRTAGFSFWPGNGQGSGADYQCPGSCEGLPRLLAVDVGFPWACMG